MAGILNQKSRIFDSIVTQEGRRQFAEGNFRAEFYSFGDSSVVYALSDTFVSGTGNKAENTATPFVLEASYLPQDQITFEADDAGRIFVRQLMPVGDAVVRVVDGQIISGSSTTSMEPVTRQSQFSSMADGLLASSLDNFQKLSMLGSPKAYRNQNEQSFVLGSSNVEFAITDNLPIPHNATQVGNINNIESLFADKRLSHIPNFKFLPPVNKVEKIRGVVTSTNPIGNWMPVGQQEIQSFEDLFRSEIGPAERSGFATTVDFVSASKQNRLFGQMFEVAGTRLTKLDIIDFGSFVTTGSENKRVFFAGKVYTDETGSDTFVSMFTLIFS